MGEQFPFGAPVMSMSREPQGHQPVFVLGAYPSALHVRWVPPAVSGHKPVRALAVDNEPCPFWNGVDEEERIAAWSAEWFDGRLGSVSPVGKLNGSSGRWLHDQVLAPLGARENDVWSTDCLDTYRASDRQRRRIADTYDPVAMSHGLPAAQLPKHPSEKEIAHEALTHQRLRLVRELEVVAPDLIVTLGQGAARVLHGLLDLEGGVALSQDGYGAFTHVICHGRPVQWLALAHPGAPAAWQATHQRWIASQTGVGGRGTPVGDGPPRWLPQRLLAAGADAPHVFAEYVSQWLTSGAKERASRRRDRRPNADAGELVQAATGTYVRLARSEGAVAGLTLTAAEITTLFGSAGTLTLPAAVTALGADLSTLAWIQCRMVLEIAALRGDPLEDSDEVARELLILWGFHSPTRQVGIALGQAGQRIGKRLLERYLRGAALQALKSMFRVVGIRFARAGLIRGLPVVNIPINAAVNDVSTRALARRADAYYKQKNAGGSPASAGT